MDRRRFLKRSAVAGLAAGLASKLDWAHGASAVRSASDVEKNKRIGVCSWSHHGYFEKTRPKDFK